MFEHLGSSADDDSMAWELDVAGVEIPEDSFDPIECLTDLGVEIATGASRFHSMGSSDEERRADRTLEVGELLTRGRL